MAGRLPRETCCACTRVHTTATVFRSSSQQDHDRRLQSTRMHVPKEVVIDVTTTTGNKQQQPSKLTRHGTSATTFTGTCCGSLHAKTLERLPNVSVTCRFPVWPSDGWCHWTATSPTQHSACRCKFADGQGDALRAIVTTTT
jgi:hypothetical protein